MWSALLRDVGMPFLIILGNRIAHSMGHSHLKTANIRSAGQDISRLAINRKVHCHVSNSLPRNWYWEKLAQFTHSYPVT